MSTSHASTRPLASTHPLARRIVSPGALGAFVLGLGLIASTSALAQADAPPAASAAGMMQHGSPMNHDMRSGDMGHGRMHQGMERMMQQMLDRVHATPEQRARIRAFQKSAWEHNRPLMEQMHNLRQQSMQLLSAPTIDFGELENLRSKQMAIANQLSRQMTQTQYEIAQVLTPAQRQQAYTMMHERMKHRMDRGGHGSMGHGMGMGDAHGDQ